MMDKVLSIIRFITYGWLFIEGLIVSFLYFEAGKQMKSKMIKTLSRFFFWTTLFAGWLTFLPLARILSQELYFKIIPLTILPVFFMTFELRKFRMESLENPEKMEKEMNGVNQTK